MSEATISGIILPVSLSELEGMISQAVSKGATSFNNVLSSVEENEFLDFHEACSFLKMKPGTLYYLRSKEKIPYIKKGKVLTFNKAQLRAWLLEDQSTEKVSLGKRVDSQVQAGRKKKGDG